MTELNAEFWSEYVRQLQRKNRAVMRSHRYPRKHSRKH